MNTFQKEHKIQIIFSQRLLFNQFTSAIKEEFSIRIILHCIDMTSIFPVENKENCPRSKEITNYFCN